MRSRSLGLVCLLAACVAPPAEYATLSGPPPATRTVLPLPRGTAIRAELARGSGDDKLVRAALVWWREGLQQSTHFEVLDAQATAAQPVQLVLSIDTASQKLAATAIAADGKQQILGGGEFASRPLPDALDQLAWAARLALGEAAANPVPLAAGTTADIEALLQVEDAQELLANGGFASARRLLQAARRSDGGSPYVLEGLATLQLMAGDARAAERLCSEALNYRNRLLPRVEHRLARSLLLARASLAAESARSRDRELLALGETASAERPFDPQPKLSMAIACNYLRDFARARNLLQPLRERLPDNAIIAYHLGWACIGDGAAAAALPHLAAAALRLPTGWVVVPRALAAYEAGQQQELASMLAELVASEQDDNGPLLHHLRRMQAAHALLCGDRASAAHHLLMDLQWLVQHPTAASTRLGELAEQGEVLVRLGMGSELPPILAALQAQHQGSLVADICSYLAGMVEVATSLQRLPLLEQQLGRGNDHAFGLRLQAFGHEIAGEIGDRERALARAALLSDTPLTKALLAQSLRQVGRSSEANSLRDALRAELLRIDLRGRQQHPLLGPELAFAFLLL